MLSYCPGGSPSNEVRTIIRFTAALPTGTTVFDAIAAWKEGREALACSVEMAAVPTLIWSRCRHLQTRRQEVPQNHPKHCSPAPLLPPSSAGGNASSLLSIDSQGAIPTYNLN